MSGASKRRDADLRAERGRAARQEVERRVLAAINRLDVALQFDSSNPAILAQSLHAIHVLERGWMSDSVEELVAGAPDFHLSNGTAEQLAELLMTVLAAARLAKWRVRDAG